MKVAIIGAGFSGMFAAYLLEKEGVSVSLFEKEECLGGHCRTLAGKNDNTELGTTVFFSKAIKELLIELQIDYTERLVYRNFLDENYQSIEYISKDKITLLIDELNQLKAILKKYDTFLKEINYGYIHPDLLVPLSQFLKENSLYNVYRVIIPLLSSFGFENMENVQAYYALKVFDQDTLQTFIQGEKLLFIKKGTSELIYKLSKQISDIRLSQGIINIEQKGQQVIVDTVHGSELFDKVLITAKLSPTVIKHTVASQFMEKIVTNPFFTCAFEVNNKRLAATYFNHNLGYTEKVQFFHTTRQNHKTTLVAFAYGLVNNNIIASITNELTLAGVDIHHLITTKQWHIFPHIEKENLTEQFYEKLLARYKDQTIYFGGSLISKPELGNLYLSIYETIQMILNN